MVTIEGPRFSTRAESRMFRSWGADIINMSIATEAALANEAGVPYAAIAMSTDYDCWKVEEEAVTAEAVIGHLHANVASAKAVLARVIPRIPTVPDSPEHRALDTAIMTDRSLWPASTVEELLPILSRFI